jgi:hypothetical protein
LPSRPFGLHSNTLLTAVCAPALPFVSAKPIHPVNPRITLPLTLLIPRFQSIKNKYYYYLQIQRNKKKQKAERRRQKAEGRRQKAESRKQHGE